MKLRVLGIVLAGGKGSRLYPLTKERAKPAVPFGGKYRIIDFVLSNMINSGIYSIYVLTQFKSQSLLQHLSDGWQFANLLKNQFIIPVPAQMRKGETWYEGTSDAIFQNVNLVEQADPHLVAVFGADHVYFMDISQMIWFHEEKRAAGTVAAIPLPRDQAGEYGTMEVTPDWRIIGFREKVADPPEIPGRPGWTLASMGNYVFDTRVLLRELYDDAARPDSNHDFGHNILPDMIHRHAVYAYDFMTNEIPGETPPNRGYWRDVGTIESYYDANMDLRSVSPLLNLFNRQWPLRTAEYPEPPAKFTFDEDGRRGQALDSIVSEGCIISGGAVRNSLLGRRVFVHSYSLVEDSIIMDNCDIGRRCRIRRAILDKNVRVPPDTEIGYDLEHDRKHHHVTESGIVVVSGQRSPVEIATVAV
ncbi:MAG: glucose-1-phosphate adenylyltransferase [Acidobacteria bacterium]|nr:glucose-1-phosphate adenylyltransferase [Acidobacteriota bacterium]